MPYGLTSNPYATLADLAAAQRLSRAQRVPTFKANHGGPFRARVFDPGTPSDRELAAAADRVARDLRDAEAIRTSYASFMQRGR